MNYINSGHIKNWPEIQTKDCQNNLSLLIRMLIRVSGVKINALTLPSGDNVQFEGWDGLLSISGQAEFLPEGLSAWEIGTTVKILTKANEDFKKRSDQPLGCIPAQTTFVFVTPRIWVKKENWIKEKKAFNIWKDVQVIDARDLEIWLEKSPSVAAWLSIHLKIFPPKGIVSTEQNWNEWASGKDFKLIPEILLAGRKKEADLLLSIYDKPGIIPIKASSTEEAIGFITATFLKSIDYKFDFFSKSIIVDTEDAFRELIYISDRALYIIPRFNNDTLFNHAKEKGHTIIFPLDYSETSNWSNIIELPSLDREEFIKSLVKCGLSEEKAEALSKESMRNIILMRRMMEFNHVKPKWALKDKYLDILPALLAGRWNEDSVEDQKLISQLAGEDYSKYIRKLTNWCNYSDSPIVQIGSLWRLSSPLDAWTNLGINLLNEDLTNFKKLVELVFQNIGIQFTAKNKVELIKCKNECSHSYYLITGLLQSLVIISVYGSRLKIIPSKNLTDWVDSIIESVLNRKEIEHWTAICRYLPLLAEGSPSVFLKSIEYHLSSTENPIFKLFEPVERYSQNSTCHSSLLWSLEEIAWDPQYLSRVTFILCQLNDRLPSVNHSNSPLHSLKQIYRVNYPQTFATKENRLVVLQLISKHFLKSTWQLCLNLVKISTAGSFFTYKMRWRLRDDMSYNFVNQEEVASSLEFIIEILKSLFKSTEEDFNELLVSTSKITDYNSELIIYFLAEQIPAIEFNTHNSYIFLGKFISQHRTHFKQPWVLPERLILQYVKLYNLLEPKIEAQKVILLFLDNFPQFIDSKFINTPYEERYNEIRKRRWDAFKQLFDREGVDKILILTKLLPEQNIREWALIAAEIISNPNDLDCLYKLLDGNKTEIEFISYFLARKTQLENLDWLIQRYTDICNTQTVNINLSYVFLHVLPNQKLWIFIDSVGENISNSYWSKVDLLALSPEDSMFAVEKLLKHDRFTSALSLGAHYTKFIDDNMLIKILESFISNPNKEEKVLLGHELEVVFGALEKENVEHEKMLELEWKLIPILEKSDNMFWLTHSYRELAENPLFFIKILDLAYLPDNQQDLELFIKSKLFLETKNIRNQASDLLQNWRRIPGSDEDGNLSSIFLNNWIEIVLAKAQELGKLRSAHSLIGGVFANFPQNATTNKKNDFSYLELQKQEGIHITESWPPDIICEVLQNIGNPSMLSGFRTETINNRSFSIRRYDAGGDIERARAIYFDDLSKRKLNKYPKVSIVLSNISKCFAQQAPDADTRGTIAKFED